MKRFSLAQDVSLYNSLRPAHFRLSLKNVDPVQRVSRFRHCAKFACFEMIRSVNTEGVFLSTLTSFSALVATR